MVQDGKTEHKAMAKQLRKVNKTRFAIKKEKYQKLMIEKYNVSTAKSNSKLRKLLKGKQNLGSKIKNRTYFRIHSGLLYAVDGGKKCSCTSMMAQGVA